MLNDIKLALRVSGDHLDSEIIDLIESARQDLILAGILRHLAYDDYDPLIKRAIVFYCKAYFGWDNGEFERLESAYNGVKTKLFLSAKYTEVIPNA